MMYGRGKIGKAIIVFLVGGYLIGMLYGVAYTIGMNRWSGSNTTAGQGIRIGSDGVDTVEVFQGRGLDFDNDTLVVLPGGFWFTFDGDTLEPDTTNMKTFFATHWAVGESISAHWDAFTTGGEAMDSVTSWANMINVHEDTIVAWANMINVHEDTVVAWGNMINVHEESLAAWGNKINTTLQEYDHFYPGLNITLRPAPSPGIGVFHGLSNDSCSNFTRLVHESTTDDQVDTVVWAGYLPIGMDANGVDSITYNIRTSGIADSTSIEVKVWKRDANELGALAACDAVSVAATTAGAWEHKTTGAMTTPANAGDAIEIWYIVTFGSQQIGYLVDCDKPKPWYTGK